MAASFSNTAKSQRRLRFAFVSTCVGYSFFDTIKKGMEDAAAALGVDCEYMGTPGVDAKAQAEMVRQAVADGYDGIAVSIIDPQAFDEVVLEATQKGVPVVAFNEDNQRGHNARLASVCQNFYQAGQTLGKECSAFLPNNRKVLMTMHDAHVAALEDRLRGAQDVLRTRGVEWQVLITGTDRDKAMAGIREALTRTPEIKVVLSTGQADTEAAGLVLEKHFPAADYAAAGFDLSPETLRLIKIGIIRFTIDQQPYAQGFYPVVQLALYCRFGIRPSDIDAGGALITTENCDSVMDLCRQKYR
jgi:simple sugar transport system substrate-binding protein